MIHEVGTPRSFWENYREFVRRNFKRRPLITYELSLMEQGLSLVLDSYAGLRGRRESWFMPWQDIIAVEAYKTDNFTYDTIWLRARDHEGNAMAWPDDARGWSEIVAALPRHLPGCATLGEWFTEVAFPAFQANYRILYGRHETRQGVPVDIHLDKP